MGPPLTAEDGNTVYREEGAAGARNLVTRTGREKSRQGKVGKIGGR